MSDFRFTASVPVRFRDLDPMDHVNHAVYASYVETARIHYFEEVLDVDLSSVRSVVAHISIDYRRPIVIDDDVTVAVRTTDVGRSSVTMEYEVRAGDEVAATAETVQVKVGDDGSSAPLPDAWRDGIESYEGAVLADD